MPVTADIPTLFDDLFDIGPPPLACPFCIVIDTNEQQPFSFSGFYTESKLTKAGRGALLLSRDSGRPLLVQTERKPLWAMGRSEHGAGLADYSIHGHEEHVQVELKHSLADLFASVGQRRDNFEAEIDSLNRRCKVAAVVVCGSWGQITNYTPPHGVEEHRKSMTPASVRGTIISWSQRYPRVHWFLMPTRVECEVLTFQILERYWRDQQ